MYDDDRDSLAAEYVLGTLTADERDQAEALLAIDPGFAEIVQLWERRLGELNVMVEAVEPPPDLWDKIQSELPHIEQPAPPTTVPPDFELGPPEPYPPVRSDVDEFADVFAEGPTAPEPAPAPGEDDRAVASLASSLLPGEPPPRLAPAPGADRGAEVIYLARRARRWRSFALLASSLAALLALFVAATVFAPGLLPFPPAKQAPSPVANGPTPPPGARFVAVLQQEPTAPAFLLTVDAQNRTLTVRRVTGASDNQRSYELWLISSKPPSPRSLGVVGASEFTTRPIPAGLDVDSLRAGSYAVSLEPAGGSPTGAPTGPVLFTGKMVETLPGSPS
jgi:anti-sigma-K factor RskA